MFLLGSILVCSGLIVTEAYLLAGGRRAILTLSQENQQQKGANDRLESEIQGLRVSKPRIDALFLRLSDALIVSRGTSSLHIVGPGQSSSSGSESASLDPAGVAGFVQAGLITQPLRVPNGEMSIIYEAGTASLEFHRLVPLLADQENADLFLYLDKIVLSRPPGTRPFSTEPTYLDTRLTIRMLTTK